MIITKKLLCFLLLNVVVGINSSSAMTSLESPSAVYQKSGVIRVQAEKDGNMKSKNQLKKAAQQGKGRSSLKRIVKGVAIGVVVFVGTITAAVLGVSVFALAVGL